MDRAFALHACKRGGAIARHTRVRAPLASGDCGTSTLLTIDHALSSTRQANKRRRPPLRSRAQARTGTALRRWAGACQSARVCALLGSCMESERAQGVRAVVHAAVAMDFEVLGQPRLLQLCVRVAGRGATWALVRVRHQAGCG